MHILRIRPGFQADHSSSSYLFYAVDKPVSDAGKRVAHQFSSGAEVNRHYASYQKWGESSLSDNACKALLSEHYDVMASESYDSWTLMIAVPKTPPMEALLRPFHDLDDGEYRRMSVYDYGKRLAVDLFCEFDEGGPLWQSGRDIFKTLVDLLAKIRGELMGGDVSFLQAVVAFYHLGEEEEEEAEDEDSSAAEEQAAPPAEWTRAELQQECTRRGLEFRKSWSKEQLRETLTAASPSGAGAARTDKPPKLSRSARKIVASLGHR